MDIVSLDRQRATPIWLGVAVALKSLGDMECHDFDSCQGT